nr:sec12-like protein 1 [Quercus suber]
MVTACQNMGKPEDNFIFAGALCWILGILFYKNIFPLICRTSFCAQDVVLFELVSHDSQTRLLAKELPPLQGVGPLKCIAFSVDGSRFATGGEMWTVVTKPFPLFTVGPALNDDGPSTSIASTFTTDSHWGSTNSMLSAESLDPLVVSIGIGPLMQNAFFPVATVPPNMIFKSSRFGKPCVLKVQDIEEDSDRALKGIEGILPW